MQHLRSKVSVLTRSAKWGMSCFTSHTFAGMNQLKLSQQWPKVQCPPPTLFTSPKHDLCSLGSWNANRNGKHWELINWCYNDYPTTVTDTVQNVTVLKITTTWQQGCHYITVILTFFNVTKVYGFVLWIKNTVWPCVFEYFHAVKWQIHYIVFFFTVSYSWLISFNALFNCCFLQTF